MLFYVVLQQEYEKKNPRPWIRAFEVWLTALFATLATWVALFLLALLLILAF